MHFLALIMMLFLAAACSAEIQSQILKGMEPTTFTIKWKGIMQWKRKSHI
ncbi:hypothetical protein SAMN05421863_102851 [Nitrosomonas communis]|uniref:Uncharacterized protein n=1 Tax=Nitrosomonas communis TaxID=44574 RepID=A0A1I4QV00_9PROT|nr:hypothetical protein SAMN05421863_102851 [Nitrosomonas communis]